MMGSNAIAGTRTYTAMHYWLKRSSGNVRGCREDSRVPVGVGMERDSLKPFVMNYTQLLPLPVLPCFIYTSRTCCRYSFTVVINTPMQTCAKNERERSAAEINWGLGGTLREVCMYVCMHTYMLGPTRPEYERWITMETDCKPVGKESNYDMLGNQVRAV